MINWLIAGAVYFTTVFTAAFALGIVRVVFVVPAIGAFWATLMELPFTLGVSWACCVLIMRAFRVRSLNGAIAIGVSAFALLMGAEALGAVLLFKRTILEHFASWATLAGALGLAGQVAFGLFPIVQRLMAQRALRP